MTWFKIDDSFWRSKKVRKLGEKDRLAAVGLWTMSGDWSADNLTDGFVPWEVVEQWDPDRRLAERLIAVGFWIEVEKDDEVGVEFHDWQDWQPTRDQVLQRRKADTERRARWRAAKRDGTPPPSGPGGQTPDQQRESRPASRRDTTRESRQVSSLPDPTRPDPTRPVTTSGQLGGEGHLTQRARIQDHPRPRCPQHEHLDPSDPGPNCVGCRDVRLAAQDTASAAAAATRAQRAEARAQVDECPQCDDVGWLLGDDGTPVEPARKCQHRPLRSVS